MKKMLIFVAIATFASVFTSCSNDEEESEYKKSENFTKEDISAIRNFCAEAKTLNLVGNQQTALTGIRRAVSAQGVNQAEDAEVAAKQLSTMGDKSVKMLNALGVSQKDVIKHLPSGTDIDPIVISTVVAVEFADIFDLNNMTVVEAPNGGYLLQVNLEKAIAVDCLQEVLGIDIISLLGDALVTSYLTKEAVTKAIEILIEKAAARLGGYISAGWVGALVLTTQWGYCYYKRTHTNDDN